MNKIILIFDFDGTLVDSLDISYNINKKIIKEQFGLTINKKTYISFFDNNFYQSLFKYLKSKINFFKFKLIELTLEFKIKSFKEKYIKEIIKKIDQFKLFKGVKNFLINESKDKNIVITLISSNFKIIVNKIIKRNRINIFKDILCADKSLNKVEKINQIINKYKVKKSNTYYIGDTIGDILEAQKTGIKTIIITHGFQSIKHIKKSKIKADYLVRNISELKGLINILKKENKKIKKFTY